MAKIVDGDLLTCDAEMIVQQCNCVTIKTHGLSRSISMKYAYADLYSKRPRLSENVAKPEERDEPGSVVLCEPRETVSGPIVACLMAQVAPGKPGDWAREYKIDRTTDTAAKRLSYFKNCLAKLIHVVQSRKLKTVAFPFMIGCGLAGGDWNVYREEIERFAQFLTGVSILIYKIPEKKT